MRKLSTALFSFVVLFSACSSNNVTEDNSLQRFFDSAGVQGCFTLYDNGQGMFTVYNLARYRDSSYPPGNTFDIVSSLVAFQSGVIKDDKAVLYVSRFLPDDNGKPAASPVKDTFSLLHAFQSPNPDNTAVFKMVNDSVGNTRLKKWIDSLRYGNQALDKDPSALSDNGLKIPADEQLGLIKKLYFKQLPFYGRPQDLVRDMMVREGNTNYQLFYKTGQAGYNGRVLGWVVGWVEENKHPYFFAMNFDMPDSQALVQKIGPQIVKRILPSMGFFEGKK